MSSGAEGLRLRVEIDREVADRIGRLPTLSCRGCRERSISRSRRPRRSVPCATTKRSFCLKSSVRVIWPGASDSARGDRGCRGLRRAAVSRGHLRQRTYAAVRQRRQLRWTSLPSLAGTLGDEAHRAVEDHRDIGLILVLALGHLDDAQQPRARAEAELRPPRGTESASSRKTRRCRRRSMLERGIRNSVMRSGQAFGDRCLGGIAVHVAGAAAVGEPLTV